MVRSDTDCEVSSESELQAGRAPQRRKSPQKKRAVLEEQHSDGDDLPARVAALGLGATGTGGGQLQVPGESSALWIYDHQAVARWWMYGLWLVSALSVWVAIG